MFLFKQERRVAAAFLDIPTSAGFEFNKIYDDYDTWRKEYAKFRRGQDQMIKHHQSRKPTDSANISGSVPSVSKFLTFSGRGDPQASDDGSGPEEGDEPSHSNTRSHVVSRFFRNFTILIIFWGSTILVKMVIVKKM
jgi:hypothetical protein